MSNSALATVVNLSPNCTKPRNHAIDKITIHHMAGNLSVESCLAGFAKTSRGASANYVIGSDGRIGLCVEEADRAWTSGSRENDNRAITIEVANDGGAPDWHVSDAAYESLIDLCVDICQRNGIAALNFTGDKNGNLTMHKYFQATACPGAYLGGRFPDIANRVNAILGGQPEPTPTPTPEGDIIVNVKMLSKGSNGVQVAAVQGMLKRLGYNIGTAGVDGIFGASTDAAVRSFQSAKGLGVDGIVGQNTWTALLGA